MIASRIAAVALAGVLLAGCAQYGVGPKEGAGTLIGAGAGALAGSQIGSGSGRVAATAIGALLGGLAGGSVGRSLDSVDRQMVQRTTQSSLETLPSGQTSSWRNPDTGNAGTVTPHRAFTGNAGEPCREFQQTVTIGGRTEQAYGTACRQADGSWRVVSN
jgi:surface antigen